MRSVNHACMALQEARDTKLKGLSNVAQVVLAKRATCISNFHARNTVCERTFAVILSCHMLELSLRYFLCPFANAMFMGQSE